jgi:hypothetical protein
MAPDAAGGVLHSVLLFGGFGPRTSLTRTVRGSPARGGDRPPPYRGSARNSPGLPSSLFTAVALTLSSGVDALRKFDDSLCCAACIALRKSLIFLARF